MCESVFVTMCMIRTVWMLTDEWKWDRICCVNMSKLWINNLNFRFRLISIPTLFAAELSFSHIKCIACGSMHCICISHIPYAWVDKWESFVAACINCICSDVISVYSNIWFPTTKIIPNISTKIMPFWHFIHDIRRNLC